MHLGNPYLNYYANQAGNGISGFEGIRYQRGNGFFGNILKSAALPLLKYLGKQVLSTGIDVAKDVRDGEPIKEAFKSRAKAKLRDVAGDALKRAEVYRQTGRGRRIRKRGSKKNKKLKRVRKGQKGRRTRKNKHVSKNKQSLLPLF